MEMVFLKLLNMSVASGILVVLVLLLRCFLGKAPRWTICILWAMVAVRLMCPLALHSDLSLLPQTEGALHEAVVRKMPDIEFKTLRDIEQNCYPNDVGDPSVSVSVSHSMEFLTFVSYLWILGVCVMGCHAAISCLKLRHKLREAVFLRDNIWLCDRIKSPFIFGIIKPKIYLPSSIESATTECVLAHERAHIMRKDNLWKALGYALLAVHWFNPIVWLGYVMLCRDIELACDEKVIKNMNMTCKKSYSAALLSCGVRHSGISVCPPAFGEVGVKTRVKAVLSYKKPSAWLVAVSLFLCAVTAVCFLTDPQKAQASEKVSENAVDRADNCIDAAEEVVYPNLNQNDGENVFSPRDEEYAEAGISAVNGIWSYNGKTVKMILDHCGSLFTNGIDPDGDNVVYLEVVRNAENGIAGINEVTKDKMGELINVVYGSDTVFAEDGSVSFDDK